jgi:hypothetical protein
VSVSWRRPLVSFFEQKAAILRDLQDADLLRRFDVGEERVGVKIKDSLHHLIFTPEHVEIAALSPDADLEALMMAAGFVWQRLEPSEIRRVDIEFQFLTPTDSTYDDARHRAGDRVTTWPSKADLQNVDFAVVFDLLLEDPKSEIHVECGIVEQQEAAHRLAMHQAGIVEGTQIAPTVFPLKSLPEVALYAYQVWRIADLDIPSQSDAFDLWSQAREQAEQIDMSLSERLLGDPK